MGPHLVRGEQAQAHQLAHPGVVLGQAGGLPVPHQVGAAVAHVGHVQGVPGQVHHGQGGAHPPHPHADGHLVDAEVGVLDALAEPLRRCPLVRVEGLEQGLQRERAGDPAVGEPAHAVGDAVQVTVADRQVVIRVAAPNGVLIVLPNLTGVGQGVGLYFGCLIRHGWSAAGRASAIGCSTPGRPRSPCPSPRSSRGRSGWRWRRRRGS